jgi:prophage maintenance system killer protein
MFLEFNGFALNCSPATLANWIFALSKGETEEELAERVRAVLIPFEL